MIAGALLFAFLVAMTATPARAQETEAMDTLCRREVEELHRFLEQWSTAELPDTDAAFGRFDAAIAADFTIVSPSGTLSERREIVDAVRGSHGRWQETGGRIEIRNYRFHAASGDLAVCSYEEWHLLDNAARGRLSSALLRRDPEAPLGIEWVHLSEVWLPEPPTGDERN